MKTDELIKALQSLKVQTGSLACLGCGHEHNCSVHGCALLREAVSQLYGLDHLAEHVRQERNAAVKQLKHSATCETCKNNPSNGGDEGKCTACTMGQGWKWNGGTPCTF